MKHAGKALAVFLLALGLMVGMSMTALAYEGNPYTGLVNTTTAVNFNGAEWYIIADDSEAANAGTVTLLSKNLIGNSKFNSLSSAGNLYSSSMIKSDLDNLTAQSGSFYDVSSAIVDVDLKDVNVTGAKLWLLSTSEAEGVDAEVRKCSANWWLRSPSPVGSAEADKKAMFIDGGNGGFPGDVNNLPYVDTPLGVRPALKLDLSKVTFDSATNTFSLKLAVDYPLWVGGTQVTSVNMDDVLGEADGAGATVSFTPAAGGNPATLTLTNANIAAGYNTVDGPAGVYYTGADVLEIVSPSGTANTIGSVDIGIYGADAAAVITITGDGKITSYGNKHGLYASGTIKIKGGEATISSKFEIGGWWAMETSGALEISGGRLTVSGGNGISADTISISGGAVSASAGSTGGVAIYGRNGGITIENANVTASAEVSQGIGITVGTSGKAITIKAGSTVIASGSWKALGSTVKNEIPGVGWENVDGTGNKSEIAIAPDGQSLTYKRVVFPTVPRVPYLDWNGSELLEKKGEDACKDYAVVRDNTTKWENGWYVVDRDVQIDDRIEVQGTVNLILCDDATLTAKAGITVEGSNSLTLFAQSTGDKKGTLYAGTTTGADDTCAASFAGIGSASEHVGEITINGGAIIARGGGSGNRGAGIGGNQYHSCGTITINSGSVNARGSYYAAGIGNGPDNGDTAGKVSINGGAVQASSAGEGAGIGGGTNGASPNIEIAGGTVEASSAEWGAGIGGGYYSGDTYFADPGSVTISGGTIRATGGANGPGIGCMAVSSGKRGSYSGITITGGNITATGGEHGAGIGCGQNGDVIKIEIGGSGTVIHAQGGAQASGIGGGFRSNNAALSPKGQINITGGGITANGGNAGAGIGGGYENGDRSSNGISVSISGGTINATGGENGAGIGCGDYDSATATNSPGVDIGITGGDITATGGARSAGIGQSRNVKGGKVTISGESTVVTAHGGNWAAGIGGGNYSACESITIDGGTVNADSPGEGYGAGIGGGGHTSGGTITINGGTIHAGSARYGAGIGGGGDNGNNSDGGTTIVTVHGGEVTAIGSRGKDDGTYYGAGIGGGGSKVSTGSVTVTIDGGTVVATGAAGGPGIGAGYGGVPTTVALDWTPDAQGKVPAMPSVTADRYAGTVKIENNFKYMDGDGKVPVMITDALDDPDAIANRTLTPANLNAITVTAAEHGSVQASASVQFEGDDVTLTVIPEAGYQLESISATDANGGDVALTGTGDTRGFTMPDKAVTVTSAFGLIPPTITVQPASKELVYGYEDGGALAVEATCHEALTLGWQWYSCDGNGENSVPIDTAAEPTAATSSYRIPAGKNAGTYTYYCVVTASLNGQTATAASGLATVTVAPAGSASAAVTANNRPYDGTEQALVTVDDSTLVGGRMNYALGANATTAPAENLYTTSIPTAINAGTYYVWYKVTGDDNHNSTEADSVTATINPVDKAKLESAITTAETYYNSIKDNALFASVAETLKKAIDGAKAAVDNKNVTASEVEGRIAAVDAAVDTAKKEAETVSKEEADKAAAKTVTDLINALPAEAGVTDKDAVAAARKAYDALTEDQKKLVAAETLAKLTAAEEKVKAAEADADAVKAVTDAINALPAEAGVKDKEAVAAARKAYDALTEEQKKLVAAETLSKLTAAETTISTAEKDNAAAKAVTDAINALPENITLEDKPTVAAARAAYDALTEDQKKLISVETLSKLTTAETAIAAAEVISISKCTITAKNRIYTGKATVPKVTVMYGDIKLKEGRDYTLSYSKAKIYQKVKVTVKGKGKFKGSRNVYFKIIPKGTEITKVTGGTKQFTVEWKKREGVTGYRVEYSLHEDFSKSRGLYVKGVDTLTATIRKPKAGRTYYVRVRTYVKRKNRLFFSAWSETVSTNRAKANEAQVFEATMNVGEELDLNTLVPGVADWESSDDLIATVSTEDIVKALAAGEAVFTGVDNNGELIRVVIVISNENVIEMDEIELDDLDLTDFEGGFVEDLSPDEEIHMDEELELVLG